MADATMYSFDLKEVAALLLEKQGVQDGQWLLGFEFAFAAIVAGPKPEDARPTAMVMINKVNLARAEPGTPPHLVVDLSKPRAAKTSPQKKRSAAK